MTLWSRYWGRATLKFRYAGPRGSDCQGPEESRGRCSRGAQNTAGLPAQQDLLLTLHPRPNTEVCPGTPPGARTGDHRPAPAAAERDIFPVQDGSLSSCMGLMYQVYTMPGLALPQCHQWACTMYQDCPWRVSNQKLDFVPCYIACLVIWSSWLWSIWN